METSNNLLDASMLLDYASNLFLIFTIATAGTFVREAYNYKKSGIKISIFRMLISALLSSIVMAAAIEKINNIRFGVFSLITFFFGMWAYPVIEILMNFKYIAIAVKDVLKELGSPVLKGTANAIDDIRKEMKDEKKEQNKKAASNNEGKESTDNSSNDSTEKLENKEISKEELLRQIRKLEASLVKEQEE